MPDHDELLALADARAPGDALIRDLATALRASEQARREVEALARTDIENATATIDTLIQQCDYAQETVRLFEITYGDPNAVRDLAAANAELAVLRARVRELEAEVKNCAKYQKPIPAARKNIPRFYPRVTWNQTGRLESMMRDDAVGGYVLWSDYVQLVEKIANERRAVAELRALLARVPMTAIDPAHRETWQQWYDRYKAVMEATNPSWQEGE